MPAAAFLEKAELKGKTVFPVCTRGGGGTGRCSADLSAILGNQGASMKDLLAVCGPGGNSLASDLDGWHKKTGLKS